MDNDFSFQIQFKSNFVLIELAGPLSGDFLLQVSKHLQGTPNFKPEIHEIWDVTHADLSDIDAESMQKATKELEKLWEGMGKSKVAIVSGRSINVGHIRLFMEYYQRIHVQAFETLVRAEKWLFE